MKKTDDYSIFAFIVDVNVNKHPIKQAVKKLHGIDMATANTLQDQTWWREEGKCLTDSWYDALDITNKTGII